MGFTISGWYNGNILSVRMVLRACAGRFRDEIQKIRVKCTSTQQYKLVFQQQQGRTQCNETTHTTPYSIQHWYGTPVKCLAVTFWHGTHRSLIHKQSIRQHNINGDNNWRTSLNTIHCIRMKENAHVTVALVHWFAFFLFTCHYRPLTQKAGCASCAPERCSAYTFIG